MKFISERFPELHVPTIGVRFHGGVADVTGRGAIAYLQSPWMQRRGVRLATVAEQDAPVPGESIAEPAPPAAEPQLPQEPAPEPPTDAVPDGTAADVLTWVDDDPDRARQALDAEQAREKPRTSLVAKLAKLTDG